MEQIQESTAGVAGSASRPANNNSPLARVSSWPPNFTGPTGPHSTGKGTLQGLARCDPRCLVEASGGDRHALPPHCLREARRALPSGGSMYARRSAGAAAQDPSEYRPDRRLFQSGHNDERMGEELRWPLRLFHVVHQVYYYSAQVKSRALIILPLVCWMCGETNTLPIPPEKLQEFQCFHPVCHGEKTAKEEAAKKEAAKEEAAKEEAVKEDETRIR
ncbi:hypothetical protein Bbelb_154830 [Branchiostoma belcheri]|nr:hypothetical protein Bbelb_154830 [Branchiostoma belcheri]